MKGGRITWANDPSKLESMTLNQAIFEKDIFCCYNILPEINMKSKYESISSWEKLYTYTCIYV